MRAFGPVLALPALAFVLTSHSWATTASDICSPTQDPCHVTIPIVVTSGATLDFGTRGLIIDAPNGSLVSPGGSIVIYAGHVEIDGHIDVRGDTAGVVTLLASNAVTIGTSGQVLADGNSDGGVVSVVSQATVTVNGRLSAQATDADGCGGQITVSAAASCAIAGLLDSSAPQGDARIDAAGDYALSLHCADISVTGQIQATGKTSGGFVILDSNRGSLTVGGPVDVSTSGANANSGTVVFTSANDIIVDSQASGPVIKGDVGETDITLVAGRDISILGKEIRGATIEVRAGYDMDGVNNRGLACFSPFVGALSDECQRWFGGVRLDGNTLLNAGSASDVESITVEGCNVFEGTQVQVKASTVVFAAREQLTVHGTVITDDDLTLSFRVSSPDTQGSCFKNYGKMCDSGSPFVEQDATLIACSCGQAVCDDHQQCTTDACDSARGCVQSPADGHPCNDGTACTTLGTCSGGVCFESHPVDCNDNLPCTLDSCDPARGCVHSPRLERQRQRCGWRNI